MIDAPRLLDAVNGRVAALDPDITQSLLQDVRCPSCGYGARSRRIPTRCPMCGGTTWNAVGQFDHLHELPTAPLALGGDRPALRLKAGDLASEITGVVLPVDAGLR